MRRAFHEGRGLARTQAFLGLAAELRVGHLQAQHVADAVPDVLGGQLHAARQQAAEVAELAQGIGEARAQAVDVGAVLGGGDEVDVTFLHQLAFGHPGHGPVGDLGVLGQVADEQVGRQQLPVRKRAAQVITQAVLVVPLVLVAGGGVVQLHRQARAQHGLGTQQVAQGADGNLRGIEVLRVRPEAQAGAGIALADRADHVQGRAAVAVAELHAVFLAVALDEDLDLLRQRVDHADADAVQAAGEGVVLAAELAARVQAREDQLHARDAFLGVHVHGHAAAVVGDLDAAVGVQHDLDQLGVAAQGLVHRVVDDLLGQVVGPGGVGVHAGAALDRVQARQDFDVGSVVAGVHAGERPSWRVLRWRAGCAAARGRSSRGARGRNAGP